MSIGMIILGISFSILDEEGKSPEAWMDFLPLVGTVIFYMAFPVGFNAVIMLLGELFSPSIKGVATSVSTVVMWTAEFVTAKLFFWTNNSLGMDGTFYLFAAISVMAAAFVMVFIRETKNKTLAEIQEIYRSQAKCKFF